MWLWSEPKALSRALPVNLFTNNKKMADAKQGEFFEWRLWGRLRNIFTGCQRVIFALVICGHRWIISVCYVRFAMLFGDRMPANLIAVPNLWISFSNCHHVICCMSTHLGTLPSRYWQFAVAGWWNQNYTVSYWVSTFPVNEFRWSPWRDATWHVTPSQTRWLDNADVTGLTGNTTRRAN